MRETLRKFLSVFVVLFAWAAAAAPVSADRAIDLAPRDGVTLRVAVIVPPAR